MLTCSKHVQELVTSLVRLHVFCLWEYITWLDSTKWLGERFLLISIISHTHVVNVMLKTLVS